jgi:hypothetical protein
MSAGRSYDGSTAWSLKEQHIPESMYQRLADHSTFFYSTPTLDDETHENHN